MVTEERFIKVKSPQKDEVITMVVMKLTPKDPHTNFTAVYVHHDQTDTYLAYSPTTGQLIDCGQKQLIELLGVGAYWKDSYDATILPIDPHQFEECASAFKAATQRTKMLAERARKAQTRLEGLLTF